MWWVGGVGCGGGHPAVPPGPAGFFQVGTTGSKAVLVTAPQEMPRGELAVKIGAWGDVAGAHVGWAPILPVTCSSEFSSAGSAQG